MEFRLEMNQISQVVARGFLFIWTLSIWLKIQMTMVSVSTVVHTVHRSSHSQRGKFVLISSFGNWIRIWLWYDINGTWSLCYPRNDKKNTWFLFVGGFTTFAQKKNSVVAMCSFHWHHPNLLNSMHDDGQWFWWFDCYSWANSNEFWNRKSISSSERTFYGIFFHYVIHSWMKSKHQGYIMLTCGSGFH